MSIKDFRNKRLDKNQARKLIAEIMQKHADKVIFSKHALEELKEDNLTTVDIINVLKSPSSKILRDGEFENFSYRYRLETRKIAVMIAFISKQSFVIVTAWRK